MYTKDKLTRITLRLNEDQFDYVKRNADFLGVSPSEFLRMVINASMATMKKMKEDEGRENDKANIYSLI